MASESSVASADNGLSALVKELRTSGSTLSAKDVRSLVLIYTERFAEGRLPLLEDEVVKLRKKCRKLKQSVEKQKKTTDDIVRVLNRQLCQKRDTVEDLKAKNAELNALVDNAEERHSIAMAKQERMANARESGLRASIISFENKMLQAKAFLIEKSKILEDLKDKSDTIAKFNEIKADEVKQIQAKMQARLEKESASHEKTQAAFQELNAKYMVLKRKEDERIARRERYPNLYKAYKKKRSGKKSFGQMCVDRVDKCDAEVLTRTHIDHLESLKHSSSGANERSSSRDIKTSTSFLTEIGNETSLLKESKSQPSLPFIPRASMKKKRFSPVQPPKSLSSKNIANRMAASFALGDFIILPRFNLDSYGRRNLFSNQRPGES